MSDAPPPPPPPAPVGESSPPPPPPPSESGGSISSMVASSASSAAEFVADFTRWGEAFGADMAAAARNAIDTASAHAQYSVVVASESASAAVAEALAAFPTLTHAAKKEFEWVKGEYLAWQQMALGKIKGRHHGNRASRHCRRIHRSSRNCPIQK